MVGSYRELIVWQKARSLCKRIYLATDTFPQNQRFTLIKQMQDAAVSIPSNIAEGYNRQYTKEYRRFLSIAYGSAGELETQILLAMDLGFLTESMSESLTHDLTEIAKMLHVMIQKMKEPA